MGQDINDGKKYHIKNINNNIVELYSPIDFDLNYVKSWTLAKDDVTPKEIFELWLKGNNTDRAKVAKYCIQDCDLVLLLFNLCDILTRFIAMSNICTTPIKFIIERGQGIKIKSCVGKVCREFNTLIPSRDNGDDAEAYDGAAVLDPKTGIYFDNPVAVLDFASLYPSTQMSNNISHDTLVWYKTFDNDNNLLYDGSKHTTCDNIENYTYCDVKYDTVEYGKNKNGTLEKKKIGTTVCRFVQPSEDESERVGIFPKILKRLLTKRKETKKLMEKETNPFRKNMLDQEQLSYKLTANSIYGQGGSKTSMFYNKHIAACTTAMGKNMLFFSKKVIEQCYKSGTKVKVPKESNENHIPDYIITNSECIYGDTDSVFFTLNMTDVDGNNIRGQLALDITIRVAKVIGQIISACLPKPQDLEYEKTFMPFCLMSRKKYSGRLYEDDPNVWKNKDMGNVNKRRDNARIVKDAFVTVRDTIMNIDTGKRDIELIDESIQLLYTLLDSVLNKNIPFNKLEITKSLRGWYVNPASIAHKVLADRIMEREKGVIIRGGDRIKFIHIVPKSKNKKELQGNCIETPEFIINNKLKIDYSYYINNQIMPPIAQIYSLVLELLPNVRNSSKELNYIKTESNNIRKKYKDNFEDKINKFRIECAEKYIFGRYTIITNADKKGNNLITNFFK
jgi:DNA polymerase delta subunit 1